MEFVDNHNIVEGDEVSLNRQILSNLRNRNQVYDGWWMGVQLQPTIE